MVFAPETPKSAFEVRQALTGDRLLAQLCRVHPEYIPDQFYNRLQSAIRASRDRQNAMDVLIAEAEAEAEKRKRLAAATQQKEILASESIQAIRQAVCTAYGVSERDLLSDRRTGELIKPRKVAYYLAKEFSRFSLPVIGRHMGGRDHTTVLSGIRRLTKQLKEDKKLAAEVAAISDTLSRMGASA